MNLKNLMVDTKSAWIPFPGLEGLEIEIANLGRERLMKLRKSCVETIFDRKTRQPKEELNDKKFVSLFTKNTIKNWRGFKLKYLEDMILVDISGQDPEAELEYSEENAELLVSNSSEFDTWLNEEVFNLENFRSSGNGDSVEEAGNLAE